jgi:hypothetical protein
MATGPSLSISSGVHVFQPTIDWRNPAALLSTTSNARSTNSSRRASQPPSTAEGAAGHARYTVWWPAGARVSSMAEVVKAYSGIGSGKRRASDAFHAVVRSSRRST